MTKVVSSKCFNKLFFKCRKKCSNCCFLFVLQHSIDGVVHLAGWKAVGESVKNPLDYYSNNLIATLVLLKVVFSRKFCHYSIFRIEPVTRKSSILFSCIDRTPLYFPFKCPSSSLILNAFKKYYIAVWKIQCQKLCFLKQCNCLWTTEKFTD